MSSEFSWLDLIRRVWSRRMTVIYFGAGAFLASVLVMLVVPETFRARAVLLPPQDKSGPSLAAMLSASAAGGFATLGSSNLSSELFVEMLNSRTAAEGVIDSLGLLTQFELENQPRDQGMEAALALLKNKVSATSDLNGVITIKAEYQTSHFPHLNRESREIARRRSAEIANAFVFQLNRINIDKSTSGARNARLYLEEQIDRARADRTEAAQRLIAFQREHGAISLEDQTRLTLEAAGKLQAEILAKRLELRLALRTESESSLRVRTLRSEIEALEREYGTLYGTSLEEETDSALAGLIPILQLPQLGFEFSELLRELKTQEMLLEILLQQYYDARLEESRDTPVVQVLDEALPPVGKAAPKRTLTVLLATILGGLVGLAYVAGSDQLRTLRERLS